MHADQVRALLPDPAAEWPEMRTVRGRLAEAPARLGDIAENLDWCRKTLGLTDATACGYLARQYRSNEQWDEALYCLWLRCYEQPDGWTHWVVLLRFLEAAGWPADRQNMRRRADAVLGGTVMGQVRLGLIALSVNDAPAARRYFEAAEALGANKPEVGNAIGSAYLERGFVGEARSYFNGAGNHSADLDDVVGLLGTDDRETALLPERAIDGLLEIAKGQPVLEAVPRRVVVVTETLRSAGAERQAVNTVRGLATGDFGLESVTLFCGSLRASEKHDFYLSKLDGVDAEVFEYGRTFEVPKTLHGSPYEAWASLVERMPTALRTELAALYWAFRERRPAVAHVWQDWANVAAGLAAVMAGVPRVILSARSQPPYWVANRLPLGGRFYHDAYAALIRAPRVVFSHNSHAGAVEFAEWLDAEAKDFPVVHNGTDFPDLGGDAGGEGSRFAPGHPVVGCIMRFEHEKRPDLWLETAALVAKARPEVRFVLVGDGPLRESVRALCGELGLDDRVTFVGRSGDIRSWVQRMDMLLLTSLLEGVPNVVVEAQSEGVPVVTTKVGGVAEVFDQGVSGWIVDRDTPEALAERTLWVLGNDAWRAQAAPIAKRTVRARFAMARMLDETVALYFPQG